ncbi:hypothetical protein Gotri_000746 [Gossypium trilobum]|uniref:Uncharacterized protein n=1 Tax=Gossypium trilobum TaxID=34281 RepID=A0A7J9FCM6_9ROSI|nr:hypothetical protein [Gossypium trilobum]
MDKGHSWIAHQQDKKKERLGRKVEIRRMREEFHHKVKHQNCLM